MPEITDPGGLQTDRYEETRAKAVSIWRDQFGPDANTASDTPDGHIIDYSTQMRQAVVERQAQTYQASFLTTVQDVNGAAQIIGPLFGTLPQQATGSTGEILAFGDVGTPIGQGSVCSTSQSGARFTTDQTLAIEQSIWLAFVFGPAVTSTSVEIAIGPQTYGPSFGVVGTGLEVAQTAQGLFTVDAQVAQIYDAYEDAQGQGVLILETKGIFSASVTATNSASVFYRGSLMPVTSEELAPIEAEALTITRVNTPAPNDGWKGCANLASVTVGSNADTLAQYIQRHLDTLGKNGTSTLVGLIGRLRNVEVNPGIEYVEIYNNPSNNTVDGRPPHSFEVVYRGSTGQKVAEIIWENHPLGIQTVGEQMYTIQDPRTSQEHVVYATLATDLFAWCDVEITPGEGFPTTTTSDLEVQIANAVVAFGQSRGVGMDAYTKDFATAMGLTGVEECTISFGVTFSPGAPKPPMIPANLIVADSDILLWDTIRVKATINE